MPVARLRLVSLMTDTLPGDAVEPEPRHRAFVYVLDPTPAQEAQFRSHAGAARFAFNHMLALVKANLDQREAEKSYGIADADLTPSMSWSRISLRNAFNARKDVIAPWNRENSSRIYNYAMAGLAAGLKNWNDSRKGKRKGKPIDFPTFHGKRCVQSFTVDNGIVRCESDRHHVTLPRIGSVHTLESTRKLSRLIERGDARILRATVSYRRGRWQVSLLAELPPLERLPREGSVVGVDVGVKDWLVAATPDGIGVLRVPVPAALAALDKRKRQLQRRNRNRHAPRKGIAPSKRWLRAQRRINKVDWRIAAIREDTLHKATTELTRRFDTVVIETLNVAGMSAKGGARKRGLNRAIARAGMATTHTYLGYKAVETVKVDRWFPSSKLCSDCGAVKAKLSLSEREYRCDSCGFVSDRDLNAAVNLAKCAGSPPVSGRGAKRKTTMPLGAVAAGCEASTHVVVGGVSGNADIRLTAI